MSSAAGSEPAEPGGVQPYRLSDQERSEAISALADAYAEGRLDVDEFHARMEVASQARLATDLDPLFADLPRRAVPPARPALPATTAPTGPPWAQRGAGVPHHHRQGPPRGFPVIPVLFLLVVLTHAWILVPVLIVAIVVVVGRSHHHGGRAHGTHCPPRDFRSPWP